MLFVLYQQSATSCFDILLGTCSGDGWWTLAVLHASAAASTCLDRLYNAHAGSVILWHTSEDDVL